MLMKLTTNEYAKAKLRQKFKNIPSNPDISQKR